MKRSSRQNRIGVVALCIAAVLAGSVLGAEDKLPKKYTETIKSKTGAELSLDMVLIPGGSFTMGSPATEADRNENEGPQRKVSLDPFYLCSTETTLELFMAYYQETGTAKKEFGEVQEAQKNAEPAAGGRQTPSPARPPSMATWTMGYSVKHPAIGMTWPQRERLLSVAGAEDGQAVPPAHRSGMGIRRPGRDDLSVWSARTPRNSAYYAWYEDNSIRSRRHSHEKAQRLGPVRHAGQTSASGSYDFYQPNGYAGARDEEPDRSGRGQGARRARRVLRQPAADLRCAARAFEEDWWRD